jgi:hypothetical protein
MTKKKNNKMKESNLHYQVAQYLKLAYPRLIFRTDFSAGAKMTMGQAVRHKSLQSGRAYPDIFIARPKKFKNGEWYHGLFIELKRDGTKLKRDKNGTKILQGDTKVRLVFDWFDKHIEEQADVLYALEQEGYKAVFAVGFEEAKRIIDHYLND